MSAAPAPPPERVPFLAPTVRDEGEALRLALDVQAVKDLQHRYCRGFDRADYDLVRSCYHPDAFDDHGPYRGDVEGLIDWARARHEVVESTTHFTGNQLVEVDGDRAWAEHYARVYHRTKVLDGQPARAWVLNLRYSDLCTRRDGEWRIAHRVLVCEYQERAEVDSSWQLAPHWNRGARDRTDPTYDRNPLSIRTDRKDLL